MPRLAQPPGALTPSSKIVEVRSMQFPAGLCVTLRRVRWLECIKKPLFRTLLGHTWNSEIPVRSARTRAQLSRKHTLLGAIQNAYASAGAVTVGGIVKTEQNRSRAPKHPRKLSGGVCVPVACSPHTNYLASCASSSPSQRGHPAAQPRPAVHTRA